MEGREPVQDIRIDGDTSIADLVALTSLRDRPEMLDELLPWVAGRGWRAACAGR